MNTTGNFQIPPNIQIPPNLQPFTVTGPKSGTSILALKNKQQHQSMEQQQPMQQQLMQPMQQQQQMQQQQMQQQQMQQQQMQQPIQPMYQQQQIQQSMQPMYQQQQIQQHKKYKSDTSSIGSIDDMKALKMELYNDLSSIIDSDDSELNNIKHLVKDINKGLVDYEPSKIVLSDSSDDDTEIEDNKKTKIETKTETNNQKNYLKQICVIFFLYLLLSQSFIKKALGSMTSHILLVKSENYTFVGQIVTGLILAIVSTILN